MADNKDNKLLIIDGNSIMNRAFFGVQDLTNSKGIHTNAIFGFLNIFFRTIDKENANHVVVTFDLKAPTFRHKMFKEYKGNRKGMADELREQMPIVKELLATMNVCVKEKEGYEADDIIGTLSKQAEAEHFDVTVLSGDRDLLQLATDQVKIMIPKTSKGTTTIHEYYQEDVMSQYEVTPTEFIDVKGLMGDQSDNIPGVKGIGEKTAIKLIKAYHTLEEVYNHLDDQTKSIKAKLESDHEIALLSKELATICLDCDIDVNLSDAKIDDMFNHEAYEMFKELEFKSHLSRFDMDQKNQQDHTVEKCIIKEIGQLQDIIKGKTLIAYDLFVEEGVALSLTIDGKQVYYTDHDLVDENVLKELIKQIILDNDVNVITHDLKQQLHYIGIDVPMDNASIFDLSLMYYLINANKDSYQLEDIANDFLYYSILSKEELLGKGKKKVAFFSLPEDQRCDFMTANTKVLFDGYAIIQTQLEEMDLVHLYFDIELKLLYVLKSMETKGIKVDGDALKSYGCRLEGRIKTLEDEIHALGGESFNIASPKQLGVILFEKLGLPVIKKTKTGYSTAAEVLEKLHDQHEIIPRIIEYRQLTKLNSTYAKGLFDYIEEDGRIRSTFMQKVASTGRISSVEPNLQNIPIRLEIGREIRKVFIPKEDYVFVDADYSQIELRLLAHLSLDENFLEAFNNNIDVHSMTASKVFHVPLEEVTSLQRRNAKAVNFGIVYGISGFGLSRDLNIPVKEAQKIIDNYFSKYINVKRFLDQTVDEAKLMGSVKTMYNRVRMIPELKSSNYMVRSFGERIAMNTPVQGSAADIIKIAMINVYNKLNEKQLKSQLILQVHDELIIETHKDEVDEVKQLLIDEMENVAQLAVPLTVDAKVGNNWYETK